MSLSPDSPSRLDLIRAPWKIDEAIGGLLMIVIATISFSYGLEEYTTFTQWSGLTQILVSYLIQTLTFLVVLGFIVLKYRPLQLSWFGFRRIALGVTVKRVVLAYGCYLLVSYTILRLFDTSPQGIPGFGEQDPYIPSFGQDPLGLSSLIVIALVIAPLIEEILFRGFLITALSSKMGSTLAIVMSALLFALIHFQFSVVIPLFLLGILLGWLFIKSQSLWPSIIFHIMNNAIAFATEYWILTHTNTIIH